MSNPAQFEPDPAWGRAAYCEPFFHSSGQLAHDQLPSKDTTFIPSCPSGTYWLSKAHGMLVGEMLQRVYTQLKPACSCSLSSQYLLFHKRWDVLRFSLVLGQRDPPIFLVLQPVLLTLKSRTSDLPEREMKRHSSKLTERLNINWCFTFGHSEVCGFQIEQ